MKNPIIAVLLLALPALTSCNNEDLRLETLVSQKWSLVCIDSGINLRVRYKDFHRDDAFVLDFSHDSLYTLNTDANHAGGRFLSDEDGHIEIDSYREFTEVGSSNEHADEVVAKLIGTLPAVTEYEIKDTHLYFKGQGLKIKFEKR